MSNMKNVIALGGSNSKNSINKALATYAANRIDGASVEVLDLNNFDLPMYGIDHETEHGIPNDAHRMASLIDGADGLVISLAEHNGSYSVAFKNVFDWMSRIDKGVWKNKPMLLMATSPGKRGGASVLNAAKTSFPHLGGNIVAHFSLPLFHQVFENGILIDEEQVAYLDEQIKLLEQVMHKK